MFCIKCGQELPEGAVFCSKCGSKQENTFAAPERSEVVKKSRTPLILGIVILAVLIAGVLVFLLLYFSPEAKRNREIREQLALAEHYLDELDYESAVIAYQVVLSLDPHNREAAEALEETYIEWAESVNDPEEAQRICEEASEYLAQISTRTAERFTERVNEHFDTDEYLAGLPDTDEEPEEAGEEEQSFASGDLSLLIRVYSANLDTPIEGALVSITNDDGISVEQYSGIDGTVRMDDLPGEDYQINVNADGYYDVYRAFNLDSDRNMTVPMVPLITGDDACVLLTWDGGQDLDLCGYNEELGEYTNLAQPMDSQGSMIYYADHGADMGYELIYVHDISSEAVRSFYVVEAVRARNGVMSSMERDGLHIHAYSADGEQLSLNADVTRSTPIWYPLYISNGRFYGENAFISDISDQAWISYAPEDQTVGNGRTAADILLTQDDIDQLEGDAMGLYICVGGEGTDSGNINLTLSQQEIRNRINAQPQRFINGYVTMDTASQYVYVDGQYVNCANYPDGIIGVDAEYGAIEGDSLCDQERIRNSINDKYGMNVDFAVLLPHSKPAEVDDGHFTYPCYYQNGELYAVGAWYEANSTDYQRQWIEDNRLVVLISKGEGPRFRTSYIQFYLIPADNGHGYEIESCRIWDLEEWEEDY